MRITILGKKIVLLAVILLLSMTIATASSPDYKVNHLLEDEVRNGDNDLGDLLFIELDYKSVDHSISTIESLEVQRYDVLNWNGDKGVVITNPSGSEETLTSGDDYKFREVGVHNISAASDSENSSTVKVSQEDDNRIVISEESTPNGMKLSFKKKNFTLDDEETVPVNLEVDDDLEAKDYELEYDINGDTYTHDVSVMENYNWTLNSSDVNTSPTIRAGDDEYLGRVVINNTGNKRVKITTSKDDDDNEMIVIPSSKQLYRNSQAYFDIQAQIPSVVDPEVYEYDVMFEGDEISRNMTLKLNVTDHIDPEIKSVNFSSQRAFVDNKVTVIASDNSGVKNVTLEYDDEKAGFEKDGNVFTRDFNFEKLSMYEMELCAIDNSGNEDCANINKTFERASVIDDNKRHLEMPAVKEGRYSTVKIFELTEDVEDGVEVSIDNSEVIGGDYDTDDIVTFRMSKDNDTVKRFGATNKKVTLKDEGTYYFEVRSNEAVDVEGGLEVSMSEKYDPINEISFEASFKDYEVPKDFTKSWLNDQELECVVNDTGDLDTSNRICTFETPVSVKKEDISVPMTISQKEDFDSKLNNRDERILELKSHRSLLLTIGSSMIVLLALWVYYYLYIRPFTVFKMGETKEDFDNRE